MTARELVQIERGPTRSRFATIPLFSTISWDKRRDTRPPIAKPKAGPSGLILWS